MYVRSLKQSKKAGQQGVPTPTTTASAAAAVGNASAAPPPIWSAIALQRHYASMLPHGILPSPPPAPTQRQQQQQQRDGSRSTTTNTATPNHNVQQEEREGEGRGGGGVRGGGRANDANPPPPANASNTAQNGLRLPSNTQQQQASRQQEERPNQSTAMMATGRGGGAVGSGRNAVRSIAQQHQQNRLSNANSNTLGIVAEEGRGGRGQTTATTAAPHQARQQHDASHNTPAPQQQQQRHRSNMNANVPVIAPAITRDGIAISTAIGGGGRGGGPHTSQKELLAAHALGLIELPPPPPTAHEWSDLVSRAGQRGKESMEHHTCPICLERFMIEYGNHRHDNNANSSEAVPQGGKRKGGGGVGGRRGGGGGAASNDAPLVILSCSHVFHKTCLEQLEKFLVKARERVCCPMCRKGNYYKRPLVEGRAQMEEMAAIKIQAWVRGRRARRAYLSLRLRANPQFRADFGFQQLSKISDYYLTAAIAREKAVDELLDRMDLERQFAMAGLMSEGDWDGIRMAILRRALEPTAHHDDCGDGNREKGCHREEEDDGDPQHQGVECPICMAAIVDEHTGDVCPSAVMLSCSHAFHGPCLDAFERMGGGGGKGGGGGGGSSSAVAAISIPRCAVCRKGYIRRPLMDGEEGA